MAATGTGYTVINVRPATTAIGGVLFACGIALAVWARLHLGRNWGMPTTQRAEPELVISGPYRYVRHPIYTGLLTAMLGTALVNNLLGLIVVAVLVAHFYYCGTIEERNLMATFSKGYPEHKSRTAVRKRRYGCVAKGISGDQHPQPGKAIARL